MDYLQEVPAILTKYKRTEANESFGTIECLAKGITKVGDVLPQSVFRTHYTAYF